MTKLLLLVGRIHIVHQVTSTALITNVNTVKILMNNPVESAFFFKKKKKDFYKNGKTNSISSPSTSL
jgi:hypothetical protein